MADDLSAFLKQIKEAADAMHKMALEAKSVRDTLNGPGSGGFSLGSSGKSMFKAASSFGATRPGLPERREVFGDAHDPSRRGVRIASASFNGIVGNDERVGLRKTAAARMTGSVFRASGIGNMRISADGGLTAGDIEQNQAAAERMRDAKFGRSVIGRSMSAAQGDWRSALGFGGGNGEMNRAAFGALPTFAQETIMSSMPTPQDSLKLMGGIQNAMNTFLPDVSQAMGRATGYYNATLAGGNRLTRGKTIAATFDTLNKIGGISGIGSDAAVASILAQRGMTADSGANSTYQQTIRAVGHAARYMNIGNEAAATSIEGLTSGTGAANMLKNFGIYTADLATGKEKTQGQIFEELAQRLTAGRRSATVEQTQASIRRGALGATINSFFQGDATGAQMFKQYMIDRAAGKSMDLSNEGAMEKLYGGQSGNNRNPLNAQMSQVSAQTEALGMAQDEYIKGIEAATGMLTALSKAAGGVATVMGMPSAMIQNMMGNRQVQGLTAGATAITNYASKGIAGIQEAIIGGEYDTPWGAGVSAATVGMIGTSMALGAIPALGSQAAQMLMGLGSKAAPGGSGDGDSTANLMAALTGGLAGTDSPTTAGASNSASLSGNATDTSGMSTQYYNGIKPSGTFYGQKDNGQQHKAIDYPMGVGSKVYAIADGIVQVAVTGRDANTYGGGGGRSLGNYVRIYHAGNYVSVYGHLSQVNVKVGDAVTKGQVIGLSGNSGYSTGPHLHLKLVKVSGKGDQSEANPVDPAAVSVAQLVGSNSAGASSSTGVAGASATGSPMSNLTSALSAATTPTGPAANAIGALSGLMSGDPNQVRAAISSLSAGMGVKLGGANYTSAYTSLIGSSVGASTAASAVGTSAATGGSGARNVNISLNLPSVSQSDAERFAQLVRQYLEDDTLQSNTART